MKYSIRKDAVPEQTVCRIREILKNLEIPTKDIWLYREDASNYAASSVRICAFNLNNIGTNGKGNNRINSIASGYAEFIERLQNQILPYLYVLPQEYNIAPDEIISNINLIKNSVIMKDFENWNNAYNVNLYLNKEKIQNPINNNDLILLPYYDIKKRNITYLPSELIHFIKGSNGMAAGNTIEEALVQGFSEVCERFCARKIILERLALPEVPCEFYIEYDRIREMIKYCNDNNYKVSIRDASLGYGLPVICTIFEEADKKLLTMQFGAHPSLPVAIERTFTEFMQGRDISSDKCLSTNYVSKSYFENIKDDLSFIAEKIYSAPTVFKNNKYFQEQMFIKKSMYDFSPYSWINEQQITNNKLMLEFLIKSILKLTSDIFVRDVSFLGFPAIDIYIPEMTYIFKCDASMVEKYNNYLDWKNSDNEDIQNFNEESLLKAFDFSLRRNKEIISNPMFFMLITAILTEDYKEVNKISNLILCTNEGIHSVAYKLVIFAKITKDYFFMKQQKKAPDLIEIKLKQKYKEEDIKCFYDIINNLSFDKIKKLVCKYRYNPLSALDEKQRNKINKVRANLYKKYKENTPNQLDLKKIFDFI